jgi:hypothetical protein
MLRNSALLLLALGLTAAVPARAQPESLWNCKDKDGRTTLTNQRPTRWARMPRGSGEANGAVHRAKSPANFPRESSSDRQTAKAKQRQTLESELAQEESMLADARKKLTEQEGIRTGDEKNYQRVLDRLKPFQDTVEVHQKNVEALKRELSNLSR